jgi:hypothetical protein
MNLKENGFGCVDWIDLAHDWKKWWALVNMLMTLQVP